MRTIGRTRLRCFAPACCGVGGRLRTTAASTRRFISSPSTTFAGARCRSRFGHWNSVWSASIAWQGWRLRGLPRPLASMSSTAHLVQMSTPPWCALMCRGWSRGRRPALGRSRGGFTTNPRKISRLQLHHRLRSDWREAFDGRHFETLLDIGPNIQPRAVICDRLRQQGQSTPRERAASLPSFPTRPTKGQASLLRTHPP